MAVVVLASRAGSLASAPRLRDAERLRRYRQYQDFYEGRHWARPRNGRSNLVLNYARAVVDKGVAYLLGRGLNFSVPVADEASARERARAARAEELLYEVYWDNDLDAVDLQVAQNAGTLGDGVYKVFWDVGEGRIRVVSVDPASFFPCWQADDPSRLLHVEVVYTLGPEELAAYGAAYGLALAGGDARAPGGGRGREVVERWTAAEFSVLVGGMEVRRVANPYGFIPFVHVPNLPPPNRYRGVSDLVDVMPINRELNERVSDQADVIRYHADPPVVFKGVTEHTDLAVGPGTVWDLPADADVKLLEWQGQPPAVQEHIGRVLTALFEVSETPRTAFGDAGRLLSGVALETELRPLIQKTLRRQRYWNRALRRRNELILRLAEQYGVGGARPGVYAPYRTRVIWPPMVPRDDAVEVANNVALVAAGLRSHRTAMDALGEQSPEQELARVLADRERLGAPAGPAAAGAEPERPAGRPAGRGAGGAPAVPEARR